MEHSEMNHSLGLFLSRTLLNVLLSVLLTFLSIIIIFVLSSPLAVAATTIIVNTTEDELNDDGDCSLREAIQAANSDNAVDECPSGNGDDTIILPSGIYTISLPGFESNNIAGDLNIKSNLTISGSSTNDTIIDGGQID